MATTKWTARIGALVAVGALGCASDDGAVGDSDAGSLGGAGGTGGAATGGMGGSGAGYMCHWDCPGGASCENGLVTAFHGGPCPCTHCKELSDCIAATVSCAGKCARPSVHGGTGCESGDANCYATKLCEGPDAGALDAPASSDAPDIDAMESGVLPDA